MVRAAGHRPCSAPLSGMPLGIVVVVVVVRCRRRRRTVHCRYRTAPAVVIAPCLLAVPSRRAPRRRRTPSSSSHAVVVVAMRRRRRRSVVVAPSSSRRALHHCAPSLHCRAIVAPLDPPPSSPSVVVTALSPSSRCRASSLWCHWAPSSHRLRIAGPTAVAVRRCRALSRCCRPL